MNNKLTIYPLLFLIGILSLACLGLGSTDLDALPSETQLYILSHLRLPALLAGIAAGAALAVSGLAMQTLIHNPLADPSLLGVGAGASLGSALVYLLGIHLGIAHFILSPTLSVAAAFLGALSVTAILVICSQALRSQTSILVIGIMINFLINSIISLFIYFSSAESIQHYTLWTMGTLGGVPLAHSITMLCLTLLALAALHHFRHPLNAWLLGESHASMIGFSPRSIRTSLLLIISFLCALITAFCGPISFIGLVAPHLARNICKTSDHRQLIPVTLLTGISMLLTCHLLCMLSARTLIGGTLPLNTLTPILGVPVILYVLIHSSKGLR